MGGPLLIEFDKYPAEKALVGEMLIAYGEIEFALAGIVGELLDGDLDTAVRILFRVKGEGPRLDVADAIIRPGFQKLSLEGYWGNALGAAKQCKSIRNQYAHCHWWARDDQPLSFMNLDEESSAATGEINIQLQPIDHALLKTQHEYFQYALHWLYFLRKEYPKRVGRLSSHGFSAPKSIPAPPLSNRKKILQKISDQTT